MPNVRLAVLGAVIPVLELVAVIARVVPEIKLTRLETVDA